MRVRNAEKGISERSYASTVAKKATSRPAVNRNGFKVKVAIVSLDRSIAGEYRPLRRIRSFVC
jgi:hypothetical protein